MDFFIFKKLVSVLVMPINVAILLLILSLVFFKRKPKFAFKSLISAVVLLIVTASPPISNQLVVPMEQNYESFSLSAKPVDYIVILGCGHQSNDALAVTSQLKPCSLQRLVEGLRISRLHPEATIITSGHSIKDPVSNAEKVKQAAIALGIDGRKIITENYPKDTQEEAELIGPRVKGKNVVLVTDAYHLPRAIKYFELQGVNAIPAPAGYFVKNPNADIHWLSYFPSSHNLYKASIAWYEAMGRAWQWIAY
ncbi:ElyC/SanA/YdcF family protein [Thalassotalea atypica]|uniref:ElyC/SanA/YdcF family protein n=1 Tax=Thalassotalea atypica TaxID=2054316 RepID=UPI00257247CA|nr:ElyC/SanA/YdcF family protein [Thalassotalea atypica]